MFLELSHTKLDIFNVSKERKRFYEIARGSLIEVDTALDIAIDLGYVTRQKLENLGALMIRSFQLIKRLP